MCITHASAIRRFDLRAIEDEALSIAIRRVYEESFGGVYGAEKVWRQASSTSSSTSSRAPSSDGAYRIPCEATSRSMRSSKPSLHGPTTRASCTIPTRRAYLSVRYTERLAEAGIERSVGSVGDSYDNALAETINSLFKTEVIRRCGPWRSIEDVEFAVLRWVHWFNHKRLLEPLGYLTPMEFEKQYYDQSRVHAAVA